MSGRADHITYEVRLEAEPSLAEEIDAWLTGHVAEMLKLPGFQGAQILDDQPLPEAGNNRIYRTVHYQLTDWEALRTYLREHAARMREAGRVRFGDRMRTSRRVLQPLEEASAAKKECSNCHAPLRGQYCAACGQRDRSRMISLWELVSDFLGELVDADSRLWRTLIPLMFRPGRLTREYLLGRRVAFTPPLRLYLISSLLFFVLATLGGVDASFEMNGDEGAETTTETGEPAVPPADDGAAAPGTPEPPALPAEPAAPGDGTADKVIEAEGWLTADEEKCTIGEFNTGVAFVDGTVRSRMKRACDRIVADQGKTFMRQLVDNIPVMLVFFLPVIAFAMKLLYFGSRRYYVEHLLFFVHYHSFAFVALSVYLVIARLAEVFEGWGLVKGITVAVMWIYIPYYLFRALRVVYGQRRFVTFAKYILLFFTYLFGLTFIVVIGAAVTALTV